MPIQMPPAIGAFRPSVWPGHTPGLPSASAAPRVPLDVLVPGTRVGSFGADTLDMFPDMTTFFDALRQASSGNRRNGRLVHNGESVVRAIPRGYIRGKTVFGEGVSSGNAIFECNTVRMRMAETLLLHDAVYSPQSATVFANGRGFYDASLLNYGDGPGALDPLVAFDPFYAHDDDQQLVLSQFASVIACSDDIVLPVCGTGFHNYGHFLFDGLPLAFLLTSQIPDVPLKLVGPPLARFQHEILDALGLEKRYVTLHEPRRFRHLLASNLIAQHVSYPGRVIRPLADTLRFRYGTGGGGRRRIYISRRQDSQKRLLTNRPDVEEVFVAHGFEVVTPEHMSFVEQIRLFADCEIVAGESGAGMANVIFCDPGTKILEIQPEHFFEGWIRASSMVLGLEWNVFFAPSVSPQPDQGIAFWVNTVLLAEAITAVIASS